MQFIYVLLASAPLFCLEGWNYSICQEDYETDEYDNVEICMDYFMDLKDGLPPQYEMDFCNDYLEYYDEDLK